MAVRSAHGKAKRLGSGPRVEVQPIDEQPAGVPAEARPESPSDRGERGKFAPGNSIAVKGGKARAGKTRLADRLGLIPLPDACSFTPYRKAATSFRRASCANLASTVGAGVCGPEASAMVASAALQLAWSRQFFDQAMKTGDTKLVELGSKLADASRQNLLAAREYAAKDGQARRNTTASTLPSYLVPFDEDG